MAEEPMLDDFDREILRRVQRDARATGEDIGADIGLSAAAVQRRLKRLRQAGVITAEVALVAPAAVGQAMGFVVSVEMERERADVLDAFRRAARADPNVQQCYYVTGAADFVLVVTARDMADFEAFSRRLLFDNANIRRFTTSVVMARDKVGLAVPV
ncbi:Lrp/AsnC family transcriptional regulator [Fulvimonas sp. R45]|jgi:DNA-binding Lrp family transcriptional regulator|uniref:Lrp/AsnC family transcriptional regulator n=1 Tax=Fulvimonas sp. R45 TaxID=3045937 RepID=UPI00266039FC|nr:Lrp/AsnC family transcriptional regulator [Fulvimonas sp. R45]MDO1527966.1 Lrp/AsnC family transcriptional regulator [Fulvimonas sp. R45]